MKFEDKLAKDQDDGSTEKEWYMPLGCGRGIEIEEVQIIQYLGAMFNEEASCDDEIGNRIGTASRIAGALRRQVMEWKELSEATKLRAKLWLCQPCCIGARLGLFRRDTEAEFRQWR